MKVSVVVIARNAEKTLPKCLSSIFEQTHQPDEVIVVAGESEDKTREAAQSFPVELIDAPSKDTFGLSRNIGVKAAKGEVVVFLDSDDYAERNWLEKLIKYIGPKDVGMIGAKRNYVYPRNWFTEFKWDLLGGRVTRKREAPIQIVEENQDALFSISAPGKYLGTSGTAYKRKAIEKAGYFDEDMFFGCEDTDLAFRIVKQGYQLMFTPRAVIYFVPARSVREWFKETFWRLGVGYGNLRRKYGHYSLPLVTPLITFSAILGLIFAWFWNDPYLVLFIVSAIIFFLFWRTFKYAKKTGRMIQSLAYVILEVIARHLAFFGFLAGYLLPSKLLRRILRR